MNPNEEQDLIDEFDGASIAYPKTVPPATSVAVSAAPLPQAYPAVGKLTSKAPPPRPSTQPAPSIIAPPPSSSSQVTMETTRKWKDVLVESGISIEFAWKYALVLSQHGYDETNAHLLGKRDLAKLQVGTNSKEQAAILNTIADLIKQATESPALEDKEEDRLQVVVRWRNLFNRAKLAWGNKTSLEYASLLAGQGWDESNAGKTDITIHPHKLTAT
ncbi:hypothetical protein BASA81_004173 [Batrachochytrium salamandrivorans]|nr:hypothetical protein BASA81_004173 [Batrachochytrium salamandrivorans]